MQEQKKIKTKYLIDILKIHESWNPDSQSKDHLKGRPKTKCDDLFESRRNLIIQTQDELIKRLKGLNNDV
jgi:hypothetical protein